MWLIRLLIRSFFPISCLINIWSPFTKFNAFSQIISASDKVSAIVATQGFYQGKMDDIAYISFSSEKVHIFDSQTEKNLIHALTNKQ